MLCHILPLLGHWDVKTKNSMTLDKLQRHDTWDRPGGRVAHEGTARYSWHGSNACNWPTLVASETGKWLVDVGRPSEGQALQEAISRRRTLCVHLIWWGWLQNDECTQQRTIFSCLNINFRNQNESKESMMLSHGTWPSRWMRACQCRWLWPTPLSAPNTLRRCPGLAGLRWARWLLVPDDGHTLSFREFGFSSLGWSLFYRIFEGCSDGFTSPLSNPFPMFQVTIRHVHQGCSQHPLYNLVYKGATLCIQIHASHVKKKSQWIPKKKKTISNSGEPHNGDTLYMIYYM